MKYAVQLYSLNNIIKKDGLIKVLKEVKKIGYDGVEFAGFHNVDILDIKKVMDELNLETAGLHIGYPDILDFKMLDKIISTLKPDTITLPYIAEIYRNENITTIYDCLNSLIDYSKDKNIKICYHNHAFEFENNQDMVNDILNNTSVYLQPDIFWLTIAKKDPLTYLKHIKDRIGLLHIKELGEEGIKGKSPIIGTGKSKCLEVLNFADSLDIKWAVLESENIDGDYISYLTECLKVFKTRRDK